MFFNIPQFKNTPAEIEKLEAAFRDLGSIQEKQAAWQELDDYFYNKSPAEDRKYFYSLFRWYTELTWKMLTNVPESMMLEIACGRQIPVAFLLDFDVHVLLLDYLGLKAADESAMVNLYTEMQTNFLTSPTIMGRLSGKEVTVAEAVKMIIAMQRTGATSIEIAETSGKIQEMLFAKDEPLFNKYFFAEPAVTVDRFIDLVNFFLGVRPDRIWYMVDSYMHPDKYKDLDAAREERAAGIFQVEGYSGEVSTATVDPETITQASLTYPEIRTAVERGIPGASKDVSQEAAAIFSALEDLSQRYKDPKIVDLYYFDETTGAFRWNDELIQSQS